MANSSPVDSVMHGVYSGEMHSSRGMPFFILDNFRSAFNVGSVFRSAESIFPAAVFLSGICCRPSSRKLRRTARGTQAEVPWRYFDTVTEALEWIRSSGRMIYAVENTSDAVPLWEAPLQLSGGFLLGNEAMGVSEEALEAAHLRICIPQSGSRNCMNVSSVAAVIACEIQRRRLMHEN